MSDQPPWDPGKPQGQPQDPPQQLYGQQPYPQGQPQYGQQGPGQYQGPPYQEQPPYPGQPYGPPGAQPPYPGPGYSFGPQPPPRRKRHLARNILAGIGAVVVAGIVIGALSSHNNGVSTTPSGSTSSAGPASSPAATAKAAVARVGSYFDVQDGSGDTYRVTLVKVIDPAQGASQFDTPDNGKRFVGVVFTIKALSGSPKDEDADNDAAVVGSNGQTYTAEIYSIAGYTDFSNGTIHVAQGQTATGAVVFQVPDGVKVTRVQWTAGGGFGSTVQWDVRR